MDNPQQTKQEIIQAKESLDKQMPVSRHMRRSEKKRTELWNSTFQKISIEMAMVIIGTNGDIKNNPEVWEAVKPFDTRWRNFMRKQIPKYGIEGKEQRGRLLDSMKELAYTLCQRREEHLKEEKVETREYFGKQITLEQYTQAFKDAKIKTQAKTWKGLDKKADTLDMLEAAELRQAIMKV